MLEDKRRFLRNHFIPLVRNIDPNTKPKWGKMDFQQMVEHVAGFFRLSSKRLHMPLVTPVEHLPKYREFLLSEKEFRENTKAPMLPEEPLPYRYANVHEAIDDLESEVNSFFEFFSDDASKTSLHPVFGELNFDEWVQLHHKHVKHHLKQFGG